MHNSLKTLALVSMLLGASLELPYGREKIDKPLTPSDLERIEKARLKRQRKANR